MSIGPVDRRRRHTLHFLDEIRSFSPVFLDTEVDATALLGHRQAAREAGERYSVVAYVLQSAGAVLREHPRANAAIRGRIRPKVAHYPTVTGKLTLDRTLNGSRIVLTALLPGLERAGLDEIQEQIDRHRDGDPATLPEFSGARLLHHLPQPIGALVYRAGVRPLSRRARVFGTVAVSSLGHSDVDGFHAVGGTTVTLGVGRVLERPVVRDGEIRIAPVMRLGLTFDHRVIDGAEAAEVLSAIRGRLERYPHEAAEAVPVIPLRAVNS